MAVIHTKEQPTHLPDDITELNASRLSIAIRNRQVSCERVMKAYLERIERYNPVYNAIVNMADPDTSIRQAIDADRALDRGEYWGWMHGMPHAVKDLANLKGFVTSQGYPFLAHNVATIDDIFVERIRAQGAIFIGKTNVPEFGLGSQTYNEVYGTTRNAYNPDLTAGGSSGGAACALATHLLPVADGSDMMGSLRNPGAFNNVVGFRPSTGRVPMAGKDLFYQQLGVNGAMGRCVEDVIRLMHTISGYDPRDPLSLRNAFAPYDKPAKPSDIKIYKVAWMGDFNDYLPTEPGVLELCETALKSLSKVGLAVEQALPDYEMPRLWQTWLTLRHWTVHGLLKPFYDNPEAKKTLNTQAIWEIESGMTVTGLDLNAATFARSDWYRALLPLFEKYDVLAIPTAQVFPFSADIHWPTSINGKKMDTYHRWMEVTIGGTLSGCPVVNMPVGFDGNGRPMGIQFVGPMGEDRKVLEFALAYEANTDYLNKRPVLKEELESDSKFRRNPGCP